MIDKKANSKWTKSRISYNNYQKYIARKDERFSLTIIDLLFVSNFKGGNGSIQEDEERVNGKLRRYSLLLEEFSDIFQDKRIGEITTEELDLHILKVNEFCDLARVGSEFKIDGFGVSYLSALLNAYFPALIPILDRRVLLNSGLASKSDLNSQDQVIRIEGFYSQLIHVFAEMSSSTGKSLTELDKEHFIPKIS